MDVERNKVMTNWRTGVCQKSYIEATNFRSRLTVRNITIKGIRGFF